MSSGSCFRYLGKSICFPATRGPSGVLPYNIDGVLVLRSEKELEQRPKNVMGVPLRKSRVGLFVRFDRFGD